MTGIKKKCKNQIENLLFGDPYQDRNSIYKQRVVSYVAPWLKDYSLAGFIVKYRLFLKFERVDDAEYKAAQMLEASSQLALAESACAGFRNWMCHTNRHFVITPKCDGGDNLHGGVVQIKETDAGVEVEDESCLQTVKEGREYEFIQNGCKVTVDTLQVGIDLNDKDVIEKNYRKIDSARREEIENMDDFKIINRLWEEQVVIVQARRRLELIKKWKEWLGKESSRTHNEGLIKVTTESEGSNVKLEWTFRRDLYGKNFHLRGFRREKSFATNDDENSQGELIIDCWTDNWKIEHLEAGKTYCYTFIIAYKPILIGDRRQEYFRFEVTTHSKNETLSLERKLTELIEKEKQEPHPPPDPKREKLDRGLEQLRSFVEFDETIDEWKKALIKQIKSKGYPPEEEQEKIERLKAAVEELRDDQL